jgi:FkbM family methyltransferase
VIPELIEPSSVVYSFGVGEDATWDLELIERFGVRVHAFDPTPRSVRWVSRQETPAAFVFHQLGLAEFDGEAQFAMRSPDPGWTSYELVQREDAGDSVETVEAPVARLSTIASRLGHDRIDILKMDVEGAEYAAIDDLVATGPLPTQLLVEFHYSSQRARVAQTRRAIRTLNDAGYRVFARSPVGYEFSFVRS